MPLSEEEKKKIKEEEEYRASVRAEHSSKQEIVVHHKKGHGCLIAFLIIIGFPFVLAIIVAVAANPTGQGEGAGNGSSQSAQIQTKYGEFNAFDGTTYNYEISFQENDKRFSASFTPFLVNDDRILISALVEVVGAVYGAEAKIDVKPILETRNGVTLIKLRSDFGYYYFMPIKEDTSEIHTIVFWKE